jgi:hypothetical protein
VTRVENLDNPDLVVANIGRAIDTLAMCSHPLERAGTLQ